MLVKIAAPQPLLFVGQGDNHGMVCCPSDTPNAAACAFAHEHDIHAREFEVENPQYRVLCDARRGWVHIPVRAK